MTNKLKYSETYSGGWEEDYWKCLNCEHAKSEHPSGSCIRCDCKHWELDTPHLEINND